MRTWHTGPLDKGNHDTLNPRKPNSHLTRPQTRRHTLTAYKLFVLRKKQKAAAFVSGIAMTNDDVECRIHKACFSPFVILMHDDDDDDRPKPRT